nr:TPA_asm: P [Chelidonium alphacytorhabdovirus 1]
MADSSNDTEMDFDKLGDPIVGFALPNSLDPDQLDGQNSVSPVQDISTTKKDVIAIKPEALSKDAVAALKTLTDVCSALGVNKTLQMENQIKTMSRTETIKEEHVIWYVRGISLANNTSVLSAITDSISDLKSEARHLSNVTNKTTKVATSVDKVSVGLRSLLEDLTGKVKESFDKTIATLAASYEERINQLSAASKLPPATITVAVPEPPLAAVVIEKQNPKEKEGEVSSEENLAANIGQPKITVASDDMIIKDKKAFIIKSGVSISIVKQLGPEALSAVLPDATYAQLKTMVFTPKVGASIKQLLMKNLNDYLVRAAPSTSGSK